MKMSVIFAVIHMTFGILHKALNSAFFRQWIVLIAEVFTGLKGEYVPVAETVQSFEALIDGELDDVPEQAFLNVGSVEQVLAKAKSLKDNA